MRWLLLVIAVMVVGAVVAMQLRVGLPVQTVQVRRGNIEEFVDEQAKTTLPQTHDVSMPFPGRVEAITLREGDPVQAGQIVARLVTQDLEDDVAEAQAAVDRLVARITENEDASVETSVKKQSEFFSESMKSIVNAAVARMTSSKSRLDFSETSLGRVRALIDSGASTREQLDQAELTYIESQVAYRQDVLTTESLKAIQAATDLLPTVITQYVDRKQLTEEVLQREKAEAEARLRRALQRQHRGVMRSPVDGVVLTKNVVDEQFLAAGSVLLRLGDLRQLEVSADLLSEDVGKVQTGDAAWIYGASLGLDVAHGIPAKVDRIYPAAFTKNSSLGVEQQRVTVVMTFAPETLDRLRKERTMGVDYRVRARIVTATNSATLVIPRSALFRDSRGQSQVFVVRDGTANVQEVELGLMNDSLAEVRAGLAETDQVVVAPDSELHAGLRVVPQPVVEQGR